MSLRTKATLSVQILLGVALGAFFLVTLLIGCVSGPVWLVMISALGLVGSGVSLRQGLRAARPTPASGEVQRPARTAFEWRQAKPAGILLLMLAGMWGAWYLRFALWLLFKLALATGMLAAAATVLFRFRGSNTCEKAGHVSRILVGVLIAYILPQAATLAWSRGSFGLATILLMLFATNLAVLAQSTRVALVREPGMAPWLKSTPARTAMQVAKAVYGCMMTLGGLGSVTAGGLLFLTCLFSDTQGFGSLFVAGELILLAAAVVVAAVGSLGRYSLSRLSPGPAAGDQPRAPEPGS